MWRTHTLFCYTYLILLCSILNKMAPQSSPLSRWYKVWLYPSHRKYKKWCVVIYVYLSSQTSDKLSQTTIHFGDNRYEDYTQHRDETRRKKYLQRHSSSHETWTNPLSAGFWSRYLLWEKTTITQAIRMMHETFPIKIIRPKM